jgi:POTRA domain, FtsQ-type
MTRTLRVLDPVRGRSTPGGEGMPTEESLGEVQPRRRMPRIDPRFARRWAAVRREQGRHRLRLLLGAATLIVIIGLAAGSLYSPLLAVRHVRISVVGPATTSEVLAVSGLSRGRPMIDVDTGAIAARLDGLVGFGGAHVRRSWPTSVRIQVTARTPVALLARTQRPAGGPGWATVDATGRILSYVTSPVAGLTVLQGAGPVPAPGQWLAGSAGPAADPPGPDGPSLVDLDAPADSPAAPTGTAAALALLVALPASLRGEVQSVIIGTGGQLSMAVLPAVIAAGSIPVTFGDGSQLAQKLTALATLLTQANLSGVAGIDLTVPGRPTALTAR